MYSIIIALCIICPGVYASRPHIVFIMADDLGHNDIGYNAKLHDSAIRTPFLDTLAENGVTLENYYVQPICTPSRAQFLSGRYSIHTGLQHNVILAGQRNALPLDNKILPEQLRNCGYDTHMVGKWHVGFYKKEYMPQNRGFNSFFGMLNGKANYYTHFVCRRHYCGVDMTDSKTGPVNTTWGDYSAYTFTRKAKEAIDNRDQTKPLFLFLSYQNPHMPLQVPEQYVEPYNFIKSKIRRTYAGMVAAMDESVKNVTEHLESAGILSETIIIFSTDNGGDNQYGGNNWPYRGRKKTLWEGGVKGVGFVNGKPLGVRNVSSYNLMHISDWLPTILRATNCTKMNDTPPLDGYDQWNAILTKKKSPRTEILHNIDPMSVIKSNLSTIINGFDTSVQAAIRSGPWKLLTGDPGYSKWVMPPEAGQGKTSRLQRFNNNVDPYSFVQLYHIDSDPYERWDVSKLFSSVVYNLLSRLTVYNKTAVPPRFPKIDPKCNPKRHGGFWKPWIKG